jgi:hypothetical protein
VTIGIYVGISQFPNDATVSFAWQIMLKGKVVAHHGKHLDLKAGDVRQHWSHWEHTFTQPGTYTITGAATIEGQRQAKSVSLHVTSY